MRKPARVVTSVVFACVAFGALSASASAATQQYPNLQTLPPRDLRLDSADITADGAGVFHNVLRFTNTVWNAGPGKLVMRGTINPQTLDGTAFQRVYADDGSFTDYNVGRFYYHPQHDHYHYDNWGRYQLFTKAEYDSWVAAGKPKTLPNGVELGTKTTSCVMDEEFIKDLPGTPFPGVFPGNGCMPDNNQALLEGISPGWGDTYDYWRFEQWIDLGNQMLPDGDYVLRSVTDDNNQIYESANKADTSREAEADNEAITRLRISGGKLVDMNPPSGTVTINNVDQQTRSTSVTVRALGRDDILGPNDTENLSQVRLSNNGTTWKTYTYTADEGSVPQAIVWNLADSAYGGNANGGVKTVYAQFQDKAGNWSQAVTDTIEYVAPAPPSAYSQAVLADSPVSYWRLGETTGNQAFDEKGINGATYFNTPTLGAASLLSGDTGNKAVTFDGSNDYAVAGHASSMDLTNKVTLEAWIKPTSLPAAGGFASVMTKPESYSLQFNGPKMEFTVIQNGTRQRVQAASGAIVAGQTYHVVGTFDGTTQRLYINGAQVATKSLSGSASVVNSSLYVGSWDGGQEFFKGTIDDAAIYNSVLSAARVQAHYTAGGTTGGGTNPPPTVAAPTGLTASASTSNAVDLRWTDNATGEGSYVVERSASSAFTSVTAITLSANATSYSDSGLSASTTYYYRVKATSGSVSSAYSNTASATTPAPPVINSYSQSVLTDGPSAYWRLGETSGTTASDQKTGNPGTYVNSPTLGVASLLNSDTQNRAVALDGTNDHMRVNSSGALNLTSAITLEAWIKPATVPTVGFESVLTKQEAYTLQFNSGRLEFTIVGPNWVRERLQAPSGAVVAGQRYHVVGTFDGVNQRLYINGAQVGSRAQSGTATIADWSNLYIGSWDGSSEFFNGTVDEAAIYARTLTAAQVKAHYDAGLAPPPNGQSVAATQQRTSAAATKSADATPVADPQAAAPSDAPRGDSILTPGTVSAAETLAEPIVHRGITPVPPARKAPSSKAKKAALKKCRTKAAKKHGKAKRKALKACSRKYA